MLLGALLGFVAEVILARYLDVAAYGSLATATTAIVLAAPLAGFGTGQFLLRSYGKEGARADRWLRPILRTVALGGILCAALLALWATFSLDSVSRGVLLLSLPFLAFYAVADPTLAVLQVHERFARLSLFQLLPHLIRAAIAVLAAVVGFGIFGIAGALGVGGVALALSLATQLRGLGSRGRGAPAPADQANGSGLGIHTVVGASWPFALSAAFYLLYARSGVVLLGWRLDTDAAGIFQVVVAILTMLHFLPAAVYNRFLLPRYHRWASREPQRLRNAHAAGTKWMTAAGLTGGMSLAAASPFAVPLVFGDEYAAAVPLLIVLSVTVPARFASASHEAILTTGDWILKKVRVQAFAAFLAVALTLGLMPWLGLSAAMAGMLVSELVLFALFTLRGRRALQAIAAEPPEYLS